ncbi:MAG: TetR/AcrR family transcriptional regulator C-terminal domain-containing protein [Rhodoglobus sp.]
MTEDQPEIDLPRAVALAWGVAANPQRGPKREMSVERIVDVAVEIADKQGLAAVSMSNVAAELGFTTMSLYRYVSAKDDLILLMNEEGIGLPPLSITDADDWRQGLALWFRGILAVYREHPWLLDIPIVGTPNTPNNLAWLEAGLTVLLETSLDWQERISAVLALSGQARWQGTIERGYAGIPGESGLAGDPGTADAYIFAKFVTPEAFPALAQAVAAGVFSDDDDDPFEFGLNRLLDGLEHRMNQTHAEQVPRTPTDSDAHRRDEGVKRAREAIKDAEGRLREARKKEREALSRADEREKRDQERAAKRG